MRRKRVSLWFLRTQGALTPLLAAGVGFAVVMFVVLLDFSHLLWGSRESGPPAEAAVLTGPVFLGQGMARPLLQCRDGRAAKDFPAGKFLQQAGSLSPFRAASRSESPGSAPKRACRVSRAAGSGTSGN